MSLVSLAINHKLRPTYRRIGHTVGEFVADKMNAEDEQRRKIIAISEKTASIGMSLGCSLLTADAVGIIQTIVTPQ